MAITTTKDLLVEELRDLYHAEKQLTKALPKMAKAASSTDLAQAFEDHLEETNGQVTRLEKAFQLLETTARAKKCKGMEGLIEEGGEAIEEEMSDSMRDLALIAAAQKVEHYEISGYASAHALAVACGERDVAELLQETMEEEEEADAALTTIAASVLEEQEVEA